MAHPYEDPPPSSKEEPTIIEAMFLQLVLGAERTVTFEVGKDDPLFPETSMTTSNNRILVIEVSSWTQWAVVFRYKTGCKDWQKCRHVGPSFLAEM